MLIIGNLLNMADITTEELKKAVRDVLKTADLSVISTKAVREMVEKKLDCSLMNRKKEFDGIVMKYLNAKRDEADRKEEEERREAEADGEEDDDEEEVDDDEEDEEEEEESDSSESSKKSDSSSDEDVRKNNAKKRNQKVAVARKPQPKKKRKSLNASDSGTESGGGSDSDYEVPKKKAAPSKKKKKSTSGGSASKDGASSGTGGGGGGRKSTGFTRSYKLSPELSALMGSESLPRHEVVKKVWAIIKERNLYDPKNKQFAICDEDLMKVMKVKRFRTFGMLKHLKPHFLN